MLIYKCTQRPSAWIIVLDVVEAAMDVSLQDNAHGCWGHSLLIFFPSFLCSSQLVSPPLPKGWR